MWCAPSFRFDPPADRTPSRRFDLGGIESAFVVTDVLSSAEAARMVATAEAMGFERAAEPEYDGVDSQDRSNSAVSWVLHDAMLLELLARIAPHVPLALHQHRPERAPPTASELRQLEAISRLEAVNLGGELARCADAPGAAPLGSTAPWMRACAGAPEGVYTLSGLSARARVYRYDAGTPDAFKAHYDEVWPGSSLRLAPEGHVMEYDGWRYSSEAQGAWAWDDGDRVSHLTVLLYLNEGFDGGQTLLHPPAPRRDPSKAQAQAKAQAKAAPPRRSRKQRRRLRRAAAGGPEGGGSEGGIEGAAEGGPEMAAAAESEERPPSVAVTPVAGSALCFGQSFSLGRSNVPQPRDALLHEGLPVRSPPQRSPSSAPQAKYVLRTDVCYTMPPPPVAERGVSKDQAAPEPTEPTEPTSRRAESAGPQVVQRAKTSTVALSSDPVERAEQLELLRSYGYDTSAF